MSLAFKKATKAQSRARIALIGPAGSGKTYSALALATHLGQHVAVIDTERGSASKYADLFPFDVLELEEFDPRTYVAAIDAAQSAGYDVLVIDSLSHAWTGKGGVLEIKDAATARSRSGDSFGSGWREASPLHNKLVDAMLQCRVHLIATMRAKTEYIVSKDSKGQTKIEKVGLAPVQRDGLEYEFDIVGDMDGANNLVVAKTRCPALAGAVINRPDAKLAEVISQWLSDGVVVEPVEDTDRLDGDTSPAQAVGPSVPNTSNIPTLEQISKLKDPGSARALWHRSNSEYQLSCQLLVESTSVDLPTEHLRWPDFYKRASLNEWRAVLTEALKTSGAGGPDDGEAGEPAPDSPDQPTLHGGDT